MSKVKCPCFLSRTNGHKLYINCSNDGFMTNAIREEFTTVEARKVCYIVNCCNDYHHCKNYMKLKEE